MNISDSQKTWGKERGAFQRALRSTWSKFPPSVSNYTHSTDPSVYLSVQKTFQEFSVDTLKNWSKQLHLHTYLGILEQLPPLLWPLHYLFMAQTLQRAKILEKSTPFSAVGGLFSQPQFSLKRVLCFLFSLFLDPEGRLFASLTTKHSLHPPSIA